MAMTAASGLGSDFGHIQTVLVREPCRLSGNSDEDCDRDNEIAPLLGDEGFTTGEHVAIDRIGAPHTGTVMRVEES